MNKAKQWRISRYIWSKLVVRDSDITIFVQIRLTQQWSSFSRMILWWSDCSASMIVLLQLTSNVKWIVCDEKKKGLSKLLRQLYISSYIEKCHIQHTNELHKSPRHHKWQRSECGWKCFNLCTHRETITSCWSVFNNWSYVDSLGLHACKRVAWRTGMNLFLWCGLVLFRLDETTHICVHNDIYIHIENTGHNEVISFDLLWAKAKKRVCT